MPTIEHNKFDDDALDRLLAEARWPEPDRVRLGRLLTFWRRLNQPPRRTGAPRFVLMALAAGLLLATGAACWRWAMFPAAHDDPSPGGARLLAGMETHDVAGRSSTSSPQAQASNAFEPAKNDDPVHVRAPNRYEQVILFSAHVAPPSPETEINEVSRPVASADIAPDAEQPAPERQSSRWAELLYRADAESISVYLAAVERGDRAALAAAAEARQPPMELLFGCLAGPVIDRRLAAAVALGRLPQPEVTGQLCQYVLNGVCRQEALVGLLARKDAAAATFIEQARADFHLAAVVNAAQWQLDSFTSDNWR